MKPNPGDLVTVLLVGGNETAPGYVAMLQDPMLTSDQFNYYVNGYTSRCTMYVSDEGITWVRGRDNDAVAALKAAAAL